MFKKTLVAVAALAAFGTVSAANFTLYGTVDEALVYGYKKTQAAGKDAVKTNTLELSSGYNAASKFGFKGVEELGNGLKVGFKLENQFLADDGTMHSGLLFRREASLSVYSDYGTVSLGRMGGVGSSAGTYDLVYGIGDAFDGGDNNVFGLAASARYDNMITYQTPKFAGLQFTAQYSLKRNSTEKEIPAVKVDSGIPDGNDDTIKLVAKDAAAGQEGSADANRYAGFALTGEYGPLNVVAAYELQDRSSYFANDYDGHTVYLGANYNCGFATTFAMVQYFKGQDEVGEFTAKGDKGIKGFGMHLGTQFALAGGNTTVGLYYVDAKDEKKAAGAHEDDLSYIGASARYVYPLSKRTSVYGGAGVAKWDREYAVNKDKETVAQAYLGLTHNF